MILYYYGSSTLGTRALFLVCGSSPWLNKCGFSSYPLKAKYVSSWVKEKGITQVTYITKLKDGTKRVKEIFSFWKEFLKCYDGGRRKWNHIKKKF
jgi:hypothetical protein